MGRVMQRVATRDKDSLEDGRRAQKVNPTLTRRWWSDKEESDAKDDKF
jgi:hypothetical protein